MERRPVDLGEGAGATTLSGRLARWLRPRGDARGSLRELDPHTLRDLGLHRSQVAVRRVHR